MELLMLDLYLFCMEMLDSLLGCTILGGDVIIRRLAGQLQPDYVFFLTDVFGVYDRPPTDPEAVLLREIAVREDGSWSVVNPKSEDTSRQVEITVASHDTTGGMVTKISEAAMIAKLGIDVYFVKVRLDSELYFNKVNAGVLIVRWMQAATEHSLRAL